MVYKIRMMPGQELYTLEELNKLEQLIHEAALEDPGEDREQEVLRAFAIGKTARVGLL